MKNVVVIGAGKIGATVAGLLASTGGYQVTLADRSPEVPENGAFYAQARSPMRRPIVLSASLTEQIATVAASAALFAVFKG
jgi:3-hydroxyacyl-CoA dehydrogenase